MNKRSVIALVVLSCLSYCGYAQDAHLSKDAIVQMIKAGLPEDVIVAKIRSETNPPKFSPDDLIDMKSSGASDVVIRALVSPSPKVDPSVAGGNTANASVDPNDPMAPHDPGVYMMLSTGDGSRKMILIERAGSSRNKTANIWVSSLTYGLSKAKVKAELPGPRATTRTSETKPVFYMYFPPTGNLGAADTITSPSQFSLLLLDERKDHRETTVAKAGFASFSAGTDEKRTFKCNAEKIRPYAYRVIPDASLKVGEYAFLAATGMGGAAAASSVVVFDFGIDRK